MRAFKGYMAVYVYLSTRAIHLEVVSGYFTEDFLNAHWRFISRCGICATIASDCGTNFVGDNRELRDLFEHAQVQNSEIAHLFANDGTQWLFKHPYAPHFGGLWEAAVKSIKFHLERVI